MFYDEQSETIKKVNDKNLLFNDKKSILSIWYKDLVNKIKFRLSSPTLNGYGLRSCMISNNTNFFL